MIKDKSYQKAWWLVFIGIAIMFGGYAAAYILMRQRSVNEYTLMIVLEALIIVPGIIGLLMLKKRDEPANIGIKGFPLVLLPFFIVMPICGQYFFTAMTSYVQVILQVLFGEPQMDNLLSGNIDNMIKMIISTCVLAPLVEEFLFRGVIMSMLRRYGLVTELIVSSVAFALMHFSIQTFIPIFFVGMLLGFVRRSTGSIFPSIIMHAANNAFSVITLVLTDNNMLSEVMSMTLVLGSVAAFPLVFAGYLKTIGTDFCTSERIILRRAHPGISAAMIISLCVFAAYHIYILAARVFSGEFSADINDIRSMVECAAAYLTVLR